jgi:hypothetical protein
MAGGVPVGSSLWSLMLSSLLLYLDKCLGEDLMPKFGGAETHRRQELLQLLDNTPF